MSKIYVPDSKPLNDNLGGLNDNNGGLGLCPQWGPGAKPLVRGSGGKAP